MIRPGFLTFLLAFLIIINLAVPAFGQPKPPTDAQIKEKLAGFVGGKKKPPGAAVGLIDEKGPRTFTAGQTDTDVGKSIDADTVFEIGSITKSFTAVLLQDMVDRGELKLDDPIAKFLPKSVKTPTRNGKEITLLDLATQSSGLPRLPDNISPIHLLSSNPYADYGPDDLYAFLSDYKLKRDIGSQYEYSNLGFGLLGHILELKAATNYEGLLLNRLSQPLKMTNTRIILTPELKARLAPGHNASGKAVANWDFKVIAGAGAIRSSLNDMLKYLSANMGATKTPLSAAMNKSHQPRRDAGAGRKIGLAWHINTDGTIWHNGGTGGYRSFMGWNPKANRGVVVLANSTEADTDGFGLSIIGPSGSHEVTKVDFAVYDKYVGTYKLAPGAIFTITREGDHLFAQLGKQQKFEVFPESETDFFYKVVDAQLTFHKDGSGKVTHLVLHQNGADQKAPREK